MEVINMSKKQKAIVVLSGGMDSTTLLYDTVNRGYEVYAISFDYNQKHRLELEMAAATCKKLKVSHKVLNIGVLNEVAPSALTRKDWKVPTGHYAGENMKQTVVHNRNMVMLALAASYAQALKATKLFYGAHAGDHTIYPDCRPEFVKQLTKAIRISDWTRVELRAPYMYKDKGDIAKIGTKLGVDYSLTLTCYNGKKIACGKCGACTERIEAFAKAKAKDPIQYEGGCCECKKK
jgi:7-cyano-7-deazaguanine synthase